MTAESIAYVRRWVLGLTGLGCVAYALAALALGRPDPVEWYWPSALGAGAGVLITLAFRAASRAEGRAATDELFTLVQGRAQGQAYWLSMALMAALGFAAAGGLIDWNTAFAALGCLMGAAFLLLFVWHDWRLS